MKSVSDTFATQAGVVFGSAASSSPDKHSSGRGCGESAPPFGLDLNGLYLWFIFIKGQF